MTETIYHITTGDAWKAGQAAGAYRADSLQSQGFIHCSLLNQVLRVANNYYKGQHGLVLLRIDTERLMSGIRWEAGTDKPDELFPHIYGALNPDAVAEVLDFEPDLNGTFHLPKVLDAK